MWVRSAAAIGVGVMCGLVAGGAGAAGDGDATRLRLQIVHPQPEIEAEPSRPVFVTGDAFLDLDEAGGLDAVLVLDTSASTGLFTEEDVDGDGVLEPEFAGDDSVLAAEIAAGRRVLEELERPGTQMAVVTFSGAPLDTAFERAVEPARLRLPLTADAGRWHGALDRVAGEPPRGMTDMAAALALTQEVLADSDGRRSRVALFFTDGAPTRPHAGTKRNVQAALAAADRLERLDVRVHTFAIGREALESPEAPIRIADATGGYFTPVQTHSDLAGLATQVARASIQRVEVRNRTLGVPASDLVLGHDGSWSALVPIRRGRNLLEVVASGLGGAEERRELVVYGRPGAPASAVPDELRARRDAVLRERLSRLRRRTEALRARLREELARELERERSQRKELDLRVEEPRPAR